MAGKLWFPMMDSNHHKQPQPPQQPLQYPPQYSPHPGYPAWPKKKKPWYETLGDIFD